MSVGDLALDRRIFHAYQQVKKARVDGDYQAILRWTTLVDRLLDERLNQHLSRAVRPVKPRMTRMIAG